MVAIERRPFRLVRSSKTPPSRAATEHRQLNDTLRSIRPLGHRRETTGVEIDRVFEARRREFAIDVHLPHPAETDAERINGSDRQLLAACSRHLLSLEVEHLQRTLQTLVESLGTRSQEFSSDDFGNARLAGWCTVVNDASGVHYLANRHLLYRAGQTIDIAISRQLQELVALGIPELNRRHCRDVQNVGDWLHIADEFDAPYRRQLANAVSYLARDAYAIQSPRPMTRLVDVISHGNLDILVRLPTFAMIPFTRADEQLLVAVRSAVQSAEEFLVTHRQHLGAGRSPSTALASVERTTLKATLAIHGSTVHVRQTSSVERVARRAEPVDDIGPPVREVLARSSARQRRKARIGLAHVAPVEEMTLAELHEYMRASNVLLSRRELDQALFAVRNRLHQLAVEHLGRVQFLARALQFDDLANDHLTLENSNLAFERLPKVRSHGKRDKRGPAIVLAIDQCRVTAGLMIPLTAILRDHGCSIYNLQDNRLANRLVKPWPFSPRLTSDSASVVGVPCSPDARLAVWTIDLPNGILERDGINYYQGVYERAARVLKVYDVDWNLPAARNYAELWIRQLDRITTALDGVRDAARLKRIQVRLVTVQSHFAPWSAYRVYADAHPEFLEHTTISSSYENWATNMSGKPLSTLAMLNNTRNRQPSLPAFGTRQGFRAFLENDYRKRREVLQQRSIELTSLERSGTRSEDTERFIEQMAADKADGKTVFCLLGKIPYDLAVPYQGGPAHSSIGDWLNHTVDTIARSSRSTLYVKPHPHEERLEIAARPMQSFSEIIRDEEAANLTVLPRRGINIQHLIPVVDIFLIWNGSSIAELGAQGARVVACDDWAAMNYPVNVFMPDDRHHYEEILAGSAQVDIDPNFKNLCAAYVAYLTEAPFALRCPMIRRSSTNTSFNRALVSFHELDVSSLERLAEHRTLILDAFGIENRSSTSPV